MHRALRELGYAAGPDFSTDLSDAQGATFAQSRSGYGVKVRLEADSQRFTAQVVKSDAVVTSTQEDVPAERDFCKVFDKIVDIVRVARWEDKSLRDPQVDIEAGDPGTDGGLPLPH